MQAKKWTNLSRHDESDVAVIGQFAFLLHLAFVHLLPHGVEVCSVDDQLDLFGTQQTAGEACNEGGEKYCIVKGGGVKGSVFQDWVVG